MIPKSLTYLFYRHLLKKDFLTAKENRFGLRFKFKTEDVVGRRIYKRGVYEKPISDYLCESVEFRSEGVCIDVGANLGWYSLLLSRLMPPTGRVIAFEPDPLNYRLLCENIAANGADNIEALQLALSNTKETKTLYRYPNKNLGHHSLLDINAEGDTIEVKTVVLDDLLDSMNIGFSKIDLVKIDVEGYEYIALSGAKRVLENVPCVICEFMPEYMVRGGLQPEHLIGLMMDYSFSPHLICSGALQRLTVDQLRDMDSADLVWLKSK